MNDSPGAAALSAKLDTANISVAQSDRKRNEDSAEERIEKLVRRARAGDKNAFGELYRQYHGAIFRLARFALGEGAEDVVSETFVRAWAGLPRYRRTGAPFVSWLYAIARHIVSDEIRRRQRSARASPDAHDAYEESHDDRLDLAAAIARLPRRQRQVVEMKYLLGLTNPEVAAALGISTGAVNTKQWRALQSLKTSLERT
ncbi:MAG: RNA polymerase sigma factor [Actinomycetota bacterium]